MADIRIADILKTEYCDFLEFCLNADKHYRDELVNADYVAFRSQYGFSRDEISRLREYVESFIVTDEDGSNQNSDLATASDSDAPDITVANDECVTFTEHDADTSAEVLSEEELSEFAESVSANNPSKIIPSEVFRDEKDTQPAQIVNLSFDSVMPLSQFFSVDWKVYIDMPLMESDFGVRAYNCLSRGHKKDGTIVSCKTIGEVLRLSPLQIANYKNMGKLSYDRIIAVLTDIVQSGESYGVKPSHTQTPAVSNLLKTQVLSMLHDEPLDISVLNDEGKVTFAEYESAYDAVGKELALAASNGDESVLGIIQMLKSFYEEPLKLYRRKLAFEQDTWTLPNNIKNLPVEPFLFIYNTTVSENKTKFSFLLDAEATVLDFIHAIIGGLSNVEQDLDYAGPFISWLHFDEASLCKQIRDSIQKQRDNAQFAFDQRVRGETLEAVGSVMGVTRERVRQLEKKVATTVSQIYKAQQKRHDILAMIYALHGGDTVLRYDEIAEQIGDDDAQIIWYLAKKDLINNDVYHYSHQSNAVVFGDTSTPVDVQAYLDELPVMIEKSEMQHYISCFSEDKSIPEELLRMHLRSAYKLDGMYYHKGRLTIVSMCDLILRSRFSNGYKIADASDQQRFKAYLSEMFGVKGKMTSRALDAKIGQIGVLIDRGKYLHSSYINVDKAIVDKVTVYIEESPRTVLTYAELFDTFSSLFSGTQINNRYCLQGVLKLMGCPFVMRKDYITKESDANLASEFEHYVEQNGRAHKSVLLDEFNGLSEINIGFFCQRLTTIVSLDGGYYMHSSQLDISEDDYKMQRAFLLTECSETPASTRVLFNKYMERFTDFMIRNNIETQGNLFGILQYMFRQEFYFSRPYISLTNGSDLTHHGVLLQHLDGIDSIEIDDLTDICEKNGIHFLSTRSLLDSLSSDFIRVGKTMLMRKELVGVDDDSILDTAQQINEVVNVRGGYCASKNVTDFSWFPELNIPWNAYLLESVSALAGDLLTVLRINTSTIYTPVDVYIGDEYCDEDMNSLILRLLIRESQFEPFASKEDMFNWLQKQGLCNAKLPLFLETEGHLVYDENRKVKVQ